MASRMILARYKRGILASSIVILALLLALHPWDTDPFTITAAFSNISQPNRAGNLTQYLPFGLNGDITETVTAAISGSSPPLIFVGTTSGLYIIDDGGSVEHTLLTPYGIGGMDLVGDINGDELKDLIVWLRQPAIQSVGCYAGQTWEELWDFSPTQEVFVNDMGWTEMQFPIHCVEIASVHEEVLIVVMLSRALIALHAETGTVSWSHCSPTEIVDMAVVQRADGIDNIVTATEDGALFALDAENGNEEWRMKLNEESQDHGGGVVVKFQPYVRDMSACDLGKIAISSTDGRVRLLDVETRQFLWEHSVITEGNLGELLRLSFVPGNENAPCILVSRGESYMYPYFSGHPDDTQVVALTIKGEVLWDGQLSLWRHEAPATGIYQRKAMILEPSVSGFNLVDVGSGQRIYTVSEITLDGGFPLVRQLDEETYITLSDQSDLAAVTLQGEEVWYYPRIEAPSSVFTYGQSGNLLVCFEGPAPGGIRLVSLVERGTLIPVWSYLVPKDRYTAQGGLRQIIELDPRSAEGVPDFCGYMGEDLIVLDSRSGRASWIDVGENICKIGFAGTISEQMYLAVGFSNGVALMSIEGAEISRIPYGISPGMEAQFLVIDDTNADGVCELALVYSDRIEIADSSLATMDWKPRLTWTAGDSWLIEAADVVPDLNQDGRREVVYRRSLSTEVPPPAEITDTPTMVIRSPVDGSLLFEHCASPFPIWDIGCADFNGDNYPDSIICHQPTSLLTPAGYMGQTATLDVVSGKDGELMWNLELDASNWSWPLSQVPALPLGDFSGDGITDLLVAGQDLYGTPYLRIYNVMGNELLKEVGISPIRYQKDIQYRFDSKPLLSLGDINGDDHPEAVVVLTEALNCPQPLQMGEDRLYADSYAFVDLSEGRLLATLWRYSPVSARLVPLPDCSGLGAIAFGATHRFTVDFSATILPDTPCNISGPAVEVHSQYEQATAFLETYADGQPVALHYEAGSRQSRRASDTFNLDSGEHQLVIRGGDSSGVILYAQQSLTVHYAWHFTVLVVTMLGIVTILFFLMWHTPLSRIRKEKDSASKEFG